MLDGRFLMVNVCYNQILIYLFGERKHTKVILKNYFFYLSNHEAYIFLFICGYNLYKSVFIDEEKDIMC